ncbi:MAG: hypothetical protein Fur0010_14320 [Bdellovibrio sp.]
MTQLNLIKTGVQDVEKRVFPRFPFSSLIFRIEGGRSFEVIDISHSGMQLALRDGGHEFKGDEKIEGSIHWRSSVLDLNAVVKWTKGTRLGVEFVQDKKFQSKLQDFLSVENMAKHLRPVHEANLDLELPAQLKYWLQADGPVEVFVWRHNDGEISRFQILLLQSFVEWEDGKGVRSGKILTKRNLETPLFSEDEFMFQIDEGLDEQKVLMARHLVESMSDELLPAEALQFVHRKLSTI